MLYIDNSDIKYSNLSGTIFHNMSNKNGNRSFPHEWIFIDIFLTYSDQPFIAQQFVSFVHQCFPNYLWRYCNFYNMQQMCLFEASTASFIFEKYYSLKEEISKEHLDFSFQFGEMVTKFLIQFLNYSLVGVSGNKVIVTAQDGCDKKFSEFLEQGYWLQRMAKTYYVPSRHDILGRFEELPVLPTRNLYYGNDEFIETPQHHYYKVLK